jgi:iron-regulated transporter 1
LAYSANFITYLLAVGFSLNVITVARAAGSMVEIFSTVVTPIGVSYLGKASHHSHAGEGDGGSEGTTTALLEDLPEEFSKTEIALERLGLWGISFQLINLVSLQTCQILLVLIVMQVPVVFALWSLTPLTPGSLPFLVPQTHSPNASRLTLAFIIFFFLSVSRLGLWIYDLTTQQLTQIMTIPSQRSSFTGVEYSFISLFELFQNIMTIIFHRPEQFRWIALISLVAVAVSTTGYACWVWNMRGHLIHFERACKCIDFKT